MAVLSKIRQRSGLLIIVIGFCLFAFIIGDLFHANLFGGQPKNVGSVNGEDITFEDFRVKVDNTEKSGQGMTATQAVNRVWDQEVSIALLNAEFEKLGLAASDDNVMDILQQSQDIGQNPMFMNQAGKFDKAKFEEYFRANAGMKKMLDDRKKDAALNAKFQQYSGLIRGGLYTTSAEGKLKYEMEANKVTFDYVAVLYSTVKDSDVKISDAEITEYMKKDEKRYKSDEVREVEYIVVNDKPSAADEAEVKKDIDALLSPSVAYNAETKKNDTLPSFRSVSNKDIAEFVNSKSDIAYDSTFVSKKDLPAEFAEQLFNLPQGEVFGPYIRDGYYCLTKSVAREAGAQARASHILLSYKGAMRAAPTVTRTKEEAQAKANELLAQITANPDSFMMLAMTNSDDSSKQQGGDLGYFGKGQMTPKFNDYVFNNPVGKIGLVETEFGFHIIKVTEKQDAVRLATIARKIEASEGTLSEIYTQATKVEQEAESKPLSAIAKQYKLNVNPPVKVKPLDENFGTVGNQRQIVKWAFDKDTDVNSVKRFDIANVGHVIAKLKKINPEGLMAVEDARPGIEPILKNKKKAEIIRKKMTGGSLAAIASASGSTVQSAVDLTIENGVLPGVGLEQKVVGTAFATPANKVSAPVDGNSGVYVVQTKSVVKAPAMKSYKDYAAKLNGVNSSAPGRVIGAIKEKADIKDNRKLFY
jgi:peptidyl-prolyl cis-trans isomerase D